MNILFLKNLSLISGSGKTLNYKRMSAYNLPEDYAMTLIYEGYACRIGKMSELPLTEINFERVILDNSRPNIPIIKVGGQQ